VSRPGAGADLPEVEPDGKRQGGLWEQLGTLAIAVLIALAIRAFVVEPYRIPSGSMFPTLLIGDHLFVNKFVYGIKIPFTRIRLPGLREPERGDVVVFTVAKRGARTLPADLHPELPTEEFVKRIVGVPGDRLEFRDGTLIVNGETVALRPLAESFTDEAGNELVVNEVSLDGRNFRILDDPRIPANMSALEPGPVTVPPGRYFMLGDNRDHSQDSRFWGTVEKADLKGPALFLYWSWDWAGSWASLLNPLTWWELLTQKMRWERMGDVVR
jgi:signal peptidase I